MSLFDQLKPTSVNVMEPEVVEEAPVVKAKKSNYEYQKKVKAKTKEAYIKVAKFALSQDPSYVPEDVKEAATYLTRNEK